MLLQRQLNTPLDDSIDLTPMVDAVFQLLIFLMITYKASVSSEVEVPPARYGSGVEQSEALILTMTPPGARGPNTVVYEGEQLDESKRLDTPDAIQAAVERALGRGLRQVVLQADGNVPHGEVLRVAAAVGEVDGVMLHIGVRDPDDGGR